MCGQKMHEPDPEPAGQSPHSPAEGSCCGGTGEAVGLACPPEHGSGDLSWRPLLCRGTGDAEGPGRRDAAGKKFVHVAWLGAGQEGPA